MATHSNLYIAVLSLVVGLVAGPLIGDEAKTYCERCADPTLPPRYTARIAIGCLFSAWLVTFALKRLVAISRELPID